MGAGHSRPALRVLGRVQQPGVNTPRHGFRDAVCAVCFLPAEFQLKDARLKHYQFADGLTTISPLRCKLTHTVVRLKSRITHRSLPTKTHHVNKLASLSNLRPEYTILAMFAKSATASQGLCFKYFNRPGPL